MFKSITSEYAKLLNQYVIKYSFVSFFHVLYNKEAKKVSGYLKIDSKT